MGKSVFELFYDIDIENGSELSNGDEVSIVFSPSSDIEEIAPTIKKVNKITGCSVPESIEFKVKGLEPANEIDLFIKAAEFVKFSGANGHGIATISIPKDFNFKGVGYAITRNDYDSLTLALDNEQQFTAKLYIEENYNLNKGDIVTISIDEDDESSINTDIIQYGYILKSSSTQVTVPDLGVATEFDVLAKVKDYVTFFGANGYGSASINIPDETSFKIGSVYFNNSNYGDSLKVIYDNKELGSISFEVEAGGNLKKGDSVELRIINDSNAIKELETEKIYPKTETLAITVPDLGNYINSVNELTEEDIKYLKKYALEQAAKDIDTPITFYAVYFGKIKDGSAHKYNGKGVVKVVYYYEKTFLISTTTVGKSFDYYDLCKDSQGNIRFGHTEITGCSSAETLVEDFDQNYSYKKLG